jgi:alpha-glucosidase
MRFLPWLLSGAVLIGSAVADPAVGYKVANPPALSENGMSLDLQLIDPVGPAFYGKDIPQLKVDVSFQTQDRIRVKIYDPNNARWEVPTSLVSDGEIPANALASGKQKEKHGCPHHKGKKKGKRHHGSGLDLNYRFSYTSNPFGFAVTRVSDGEVLFNSSVIERSLVFEDQYLEISSILPNDPNIYGLGERVDSLRLNNSGKIYTMWSSDAGTPVGQNLYGVHPMYMDLRSSGKSHAVWLRNSNAMEVQLNKDQITYFVTGGVLDFFVFVGGETPEETTKQYHDLVGYPYMPNYWTLGWHQCRWGTTNLSVLETVVEKYAENNIPLETIWSDIDYMDQHHDYSWDPVNFPEDQIKTFVSKLHDNGQHYVVIVDPGIPYLPGAGYAPYDTGVQQDIFIKNSTGDIFVGKVWPGLTAFPDFLNPKTTDWWYSQISEFLTQVPIDGLWIDMSNLFPLTFWLILSLS